MKPARPWVLVCLAGVLFGCGQKGPLVMPDAQKHKRSIPAPPAAPKPAPAGPGAATTPAPASPSAAAPTDPPAHP
ncbi:MAG: LPS translocon maturation chaperone LptM [Steroidobacteraceae bacterium]